MERSVLFMFRLQGNTIKNCHWCTEFPIKWWIQEMIVKSRTKINCEINWDKYLQNKKRYSVILTNKLIISSIVLSKQLNFLQGLILFWLINTTLISAHILKSLPFLSTLPSLFKWTPTILKLYLCTRKTSSLIWLLE